jgi:hypothetical protein
MKKQTKKIVTGPSPIIPIAQNVTQKEFDDMGHKFEKALMDVKGIEIKFPEYNEWLERIYDTGYSNVTEGSRPEVDDSYPNELSHMECGGERVRLLYETLEHIMGDAGIWHAPSRFRSGYVRPEARPVYFKFVDQPRPEVYAKIYGCVKTSKAFDFARKLGKWKEKDPELVLDGKFHDDLANFEARNKLCLYVPFESLSKVVEWLAENKDDFHPIEFNHPIGVQLFPGVSAVITETESTMTSFDTSIDDNLREARTETKTKQEFLSRAKDYLENCRLERYYFRYLKSKQGEKNG